MRSYEFIERRAIDETLERFIKHGLVSRDNIHLREIFENNVELADNAKAFIAREKQNSLIPKIGQCYAPIGITYFGPMKLLEIRYSQTIMELIAIPDDYIFSINNTKHRFPGNANTALGVGETLFFADTSNQHVMLSHITLSLSEPGWQVQYVKIDKNGEEK
jgi:hypothetical protein